MAQATKSVSFVLTADGLTGIISQFYEEMVCATKKRGSRIRFEIDKDQFMDPLAETLARSVEYLSGENDGLKASIAEMRLVELGQCMSPPLSVKDMEAIAAGKYRLEGASNLPEGISLVKKPASKPGQFKEIKKYGPGFFSGLEKNIDEEDENDATVPGTRIPEEQSNEPLSFEARTNGWLSPEGKYYPCTSGEEWKLHVRATEEIVQDVFHVPAGSVNEVEYLLDRGWVQLRRNEIFAFGRTKFTEAQVNGLFDYVNRNNYTDIRYENEKMPFKDFLQKING